MLLFYFPTFTSFSNALIGPPEDNRQFYWFLWYGSRALFDADLPFMHSFITYYPEGGNLYLANYFYYGVFLTVLLKAFLTTPAIFNLLVLHGYVFAGMGAFFLIRYITKNFAVSLVGGFIYAFNPLHFAHSLHHVTIASIQFIPLFVLFYLKTIREGRIRNVLLTAGFLLLCALCDWNYLVYGILFLYFSRNSALGFNWKGVL